jgi:hypothetical protein
MSITPAVSPGRLCCPGFFYWGRRHLYIAIKSRIDENLQASHGVCQSLLDARLANLIWHRFKNGENSALLYS